MTANMEDGQILEQIRHLIEEEQRLYQDVDAASHERLTVLQVQLDQAWDLLRQRRALRDADQDPNQAHLRDPGTVENYEQ